jgi:hypothetical protein
MRPAAALVTLVCALAVCSGQRQQQQPQPVTVTVGRPSLWTLEQAHYLLSRIHAANLDLAGARPTGDDLNPSQTHGSRLEVMRQFFAATVGVDLSAGAINRAATDVFRTSFDAGAQRKRALLVRLDQRREESLGLAGDIATLQGQIAAMADTDPDRKSRQQELTGTQGRKAAVDAEVTSLQADIDKIEDPQKLELTNPAMPSGSSMPEGLTKKVVDKLSEGTAPGLSTPRLHASQILDNYVQMQYELVAKQLTLLRDETSPDKRLIFLELPYSMYTVPKKADGRLVQVKWKVTGLCGAPAKPNITSAVTEEQGEQSHPARFKGVRLQPCPAPSKAIPPPPEPAPGQPEVRTVDLIPRQAALNVNEAHNLYKGWRIGAAFQWLLLGGTVDFQRQRELYEQFMQQETYASGFGKGVAEFGWTFGPLPGSTRIAPGVRTTYAILEVPRDAEGIRLEVNACHYKRENHPDAAEAQSSNCSADTFDLDIPGNKPKDSFYVTEADYSPVRSGERTTVTLHGYQFSSQIGVLVAGVPLRRVVAIGWPEVSRGYVTALTTPSNPLAVDGEYEIVNSETLVLSFQMSPSFEGTPLISLVTPNKTRPINYLRLWFDRPIRAENATFNDLAAEWPMFMSPLAITEVRLLNVTKGRAYALVAGKGLAGVNSIRVDGVETCRMTPSTGSTRELIEFDYSPRSSWDVTVSRVRGQSRDEASLTVTNPHFMRISGSEILKNKPDEKQPRLWSMRLRITGSGFGNAPDIVANSPNHVVTVDAISSSEVLLDLTTPEREVIITVANNETGASRRVRIVRPNDPIPASPPKEEKPPDKPKPGSA